MDINIILINIPFHMQAEFFALHFQLGMTAMTYYSKTSDTGQFIYM